MSENRANCLSTFLLLFKQFLFVGWIEVLYTHNGKWFENINSKASGKDSQGSGEFLKDPKYNKERESVDSLVFAPPIYNFLQYVNTYNVEKTVLDCGAGGKKPPLVLFFKHGYKVFGIDTSDSQIEAARNFALLNRINIHMKKADMREIPFRDETFGCVFSWNSSIHLTKKDTELAVNEMLRVLRRGGLMYINFIWKKGMRARDLGEEREPGEFWARIKGKETVHSWFSENEVAQLFRSVELVYKQKRQLSLMRGNKLVNEAYLDYVIRKP